MTVVNFRVRMPSDLHAEVSLLSRALGVPTHDVIVRALEDAVDRARSHSALNDAMNALARADSSAPRSADPTQPEARAPEAEAVPVLPDSPPVQSHTLSKEQRDHVGRRMYGALKLAKMTTRQAAEEMGFPLDSFEGLVAGNALCSDADYSRGLAWAEGKFKVGKVA